MSETAKDKLLSRVIWWGCAGVFVFSALPIFI